MIDGGRVLVVSFFYPPDPAVGGRRVAKFARYLPEFGWQPTILTAATATSRGEPADTADVIATGWWSPWAELPGTDASAGESAGRQGTSLSQRAQASGRLARGAYTAARHLLPLSTVRMPDATLGWVPHAVRRGLDLLSSRRFDVLVSSFGPPSSHIVAARLQARSRLPWIADFRDLWSANHWDYRIPPFRWAERALERRVLRNASAITTVAPGWVDRLESLHQAPTHVVYNGFDPADYPDQPAPGTPAPDPGPLAITYVGSLYWPEQDPSPLFAAVARLQESRSGDLDDARFQLRFLGTGGGTVEGLARSFGIASRVRILPRVEHRECLALQRRSSALLLLGWRDGAQGVVPAKLFEYLGARRPILGVGAGGTVSDLLRECGHPAPGSDPGVIARRLETWLDEFARIGRIPFEADSAAIEKYTRRRQTERMAEILEEAAGR